MKPLTKNQIVALVLDAKKAFETCAIEEIDALRETIARERESEGDPFACAAAVSPSALFTAWRRRETARSMEMRGKKPVESFHDVSSGDFLFIRAHFISFFDASAANRIFERASQDEARRFLFVIKNECAKSGWMKFPEYPENICRCQYKCALADADSAQLKRILFTVRSRASARKKA